MREKPRKKPLRTEIVGSPSSLPPASAGAARARLAAPSLLNTLGGRGEKVKWKELQSRGGQAQSSDFIFIEAKHGRSVFCFFFFLNSAFFFFFFPFFQETYFGGEGFALGICFAQQLKSELDS